MPRFAVILPAAGGSTRFGAPKLVQDLRGLPVIARALLPFVQRSDTHQVLLTVAIGRADEIWEALSLEPTIKNRLGGQIALIPGGANRAESVRNALRRVPAEIEWVAIHDAARPLVSQELIDRTLAAAVEYGAAAPALPVQSTIKQSSATSLPAKVGRTVARNELWAMQTPQIMRREVLLRAFETCVYPLEHITDDLQLLELAGEPAWLVPGDERNIKITTPLDLMLAEMLLRRA